MKHIPKRWPWLNQKVMISALKKSYISSKILISFFPNLESVEPCSGTHVSNSADVQGFVILGVKSTHPGHKSLRCVTGNRSQISRTAGLQLISEVKDLYDYINGQDVTDEKIVSALTDVTIHVLL